MKTTLSLIFLLSFWLLYQRAQAQNAVRGDSLLRVFKAMPSSQQDTVRVNLLHDIAFHYHLNKPDTTLLLGQQGYQLAQKLNYQKGESRALNVMAFGYVQLGDYAKSLNLYNKAKEIESRTKNTKQLINTLNNISDCYMQQGDWHRALQTMKECYQIFKSTPTANPGVEPIILSNLSEDYYNLRQLDSASYYLNKALALSKKHNSPTITVVYYTLGDVAVARGQTKQALSYYQQGVKMAANDNNFTLLHESYYRLAKLYQQTAQPDSTLHFAKLALNFSQKASYANGILKASQLLAKLYKGKNDTEALRYFEIATAAKDSLFSQDRVKQLLSYSFEEKQKQQEIEAANAEYRNSIKNYIFIGVLAILAGITAFFYRNIQRERKAKALLHKQKEEIDLQRSKAEKALSELTTTQAQLVQKEKLASLGELTAGIAHEIQNPLNFVNNFSEMSVELIEEIKQERKGRSEQRDESLIDELLADLSQNQAKIYHHGKRASSIVSGMLEHSRTSTGERVMTDINKLADEYLRLSYHGMRAKYKDHFNADYELIADEKLPLINVVPQDIGRVLLNLINNAFWAVAERSRSHRSDYSPKVTISTRWLSVAAGAPAEASNEAQILVSDNGNGIPADILPKIFQPFFTTKPTGEGTGLGLSLSYDIITKGHGGTIGIESMEGAGTTFIVKIPIQ